MNNRERSSSEEEVEPRGVTESGAGKYPKRVGFPDGTSRLVHNAEQEIEAAEEARQYRLN